MTDSFWQYWQHIPQNISPILITLGPLKVHYYGLMYILAFLTTYFIVNHRIKKEKSFNISTDTLQGLMTSMIIGLLIGARLGYVLFYNFSHYISHPLEIFIPFEFSNGIQFTGIMGMSYHGGLLGVIIATIYSTKTYRLDFRKIVDLFVPAIPLGYTFGRIGNFINGELFGRETTALYGMYFPQDTKGLLRHPSQLYEAFFEGIFLFIVLWILKKYDKPKGVTLSYYLVGYGIVRFFIEFAREPDAHIGFVYLHFSMGQILCALMILSGILWYSYLKIHQPIQALKHGETR